MALMPPFAVTALVLILARAMTELWLSRLNQHHVRAHAIEVPPAFCGNIEEATYCRSVDYKLAKRRFGDIAAVFVVVVLFVVYFSGVLPWWFCRLSEIVGDLL